MSSAGLAAFELSFQVSPIILVGGLAAFIPGQMLPIISITEAASFTQGILSGASVDLDSFFGNFEPLPGSTLQRWQIGTYPFANQTVAANAVIADPLNISLRMVCPAKGPGGYAVKLATMMALKASLDKHISLGGVFTVATPAFIYTNLLLRELSDVSGGESAQRQSAYRWDFYQPLLSLSQAQRVQNSLMSKLSQQTAFNGTPASSGLATNVGSAASLAGASVVPAQVGAAGAGAAGTLITPSSAPDGFASP